MCEVRENNIDNKIVSFNLRNKREHPFRELEKEIQNDPEYAWAIFCNIVMPIFVTGDIENQDANYFAARIMEHLFKVDMTRHEHYEKSYRKI